MRKIVLNQTLDSAYKMIDSNLVELKSAIIGLCSDIDRYFKVAFDVNLNKEIDEESFRRILYVYPQFSRLNIEQFNRFVLLFINIRAIHAHLYLSKPIFVDDDLKEFMCSLFKPQYFLVDDRKLTVYGCVVVLGIFAQKYMIWPFVSSFFRHEFFSEIGKSKEMSNFQTNQQRILNKICGIGKPLTQNAEKVSGVDTQYVNDALKKTFTLIFFDLEKVLTPIESCRNKTPSIAGMLRRDQNFDEAVINDVAKLRNCWFHGYFINDFVETNDGGFIFTFDFACKVLEEVSEIGKRDLARYGLVVNDISYFAINFYNFYVLRLVEVSYKILDKALLTEDKLESRLDNMDMAFKRFINVEASYFEKLSKLYHQEQMRWSVGASKFLDFLPRKFDTSNLRILKLHCDNGFTIGDYKTYRKDIVLAVVKFENHEFNRVNDCDLQSTTGNESRRISKYITLEEIHF